MFPGGFQDETYIDWERSYKWTAHERWNQALSQPVFRKLLRDDQFAEIALRAVRIGRAHLHFTFEYGASRRVESSTALAVCKRLLE